jgi:hypothetical protein
MPASTFAGSFLGVLLAFLLNYIWNFLRDENLKFEEEYLIKAELSSIEHNLDPEIGGRSHPIKPVYGADHVRKYRLFGENRTRVIGWYNEFEKYNFDLADLEERQKETRTQEDRVSITSEFNTLRNTKHNVMVGILHTDWLKRIPDDRNNEGLSFPKFIRYLLGLDAMEEPIKFGWWQFWKAITFSDVSKIVERKKRQVKSWWEKH